MRERGVSSVRRQWLRSIPLSRDVASRQANESARVSRQAPRTLLQQSKCGSVYNSRKHEVHGRQKVMDAEYRCYEEGCERVQKSEYELLVQELYLFTTLVVRLPIVVVLLLLLPIFRLSLLLLVWAYHDTARWPLRRACVAELLF